MRRSRTMLQMQRNKNLQTPPRHDCRLTTLSTNCNCGASTVFSTVSIRCIPKSCTFGISTVLRPLLHKRRVRTLSMYWIWSDIENILDCWNLSLKEHKEVSNTKNPSPSWEKPNSSRTPSSSMKTLSTLPRNPLWDSWAPPWTRK